MKIEIEIEDLSKFIDAYNHAYIAFDNEVKQSIFSELGEENVSKDLLEPLRKAVISEFLILKNVYTQLLEMEKEKQNGS